MNNLNLPQVAANQNQKEVTINDQVIALDAALTETFIVNTSTGSATLSTAQFTRSFLFVCSGHAVAATLMLPGIKRVFAVKNSGTALLTVGSIAIPVNGIRQLYTDGTDVYELTGGSGGGIPDAPTDGKTYGRRNSVWVDIEAASVAHAFAPHSGTTTASSSAYAAKGGMFSPLINMQIYGLSVYANVVVGGTYSLELWEISSTNTLVAKLGSVDGLTFTTAAARFVLGTLTSAAAVLAGSKYAVMLVRKDSTDTTSCGATTSSQVAASAPVDTNTTYVRIAKRALTVGDTLETGSTPFAAGIFWSL